MTRSTDFAEVIAARMPENQAGVRVVRQQAGALQLAAPAPTENMIAARARCYDFNLDSEGEKR